MKTKIVGTPTCRMTAIMTGLTGTSTSGRVTTRVLFRHCSGYVTAGG